MDYVQFLDDNLNDYLNSLPNVNKMDYTSLITSHGDKCDQYVSILKDEIPEKAIRLLHLQSYITPFTYEVRHTDKGFVPVNKWILKSYNDFLPYLKNYIK